MRPDRRYHPDGATFVLHWYHAEVSQLLHWAVSRQFACHDRMIPGEPKHRSSIQRPASIHIEADVWGELTKMQRCGLCMTMTCAVPAWKLTHLMPLIMVQAKQVGLLQQARCFLLLCIPQGLGACFWQALCRVEGAAGALPKSRQANA